MVSFDVKKDIVAATGLQGCGKTLLLVSLAKKYYDQGFPIYSNITLKKPYFKDYTHITTLKQLEKMKYGFALLDEVWIWVYARSSMSKLNQDIIRIIMLNRKNDISIWYSMQLSQADKLLRGVTRYYLHPIIENYIQPDNEQYLKAKVYNQIGYKIGDLFIDDISKYFPMFDTREVVYQIDKGERPGTELEQEFHNYVTKKVDEKICRLLPNSGMNLFPGDELIGQYLFDVKGLTTIRKNYYLVQLTHKWDDYFNCQQIFGFLPYWSIKYNNKWYVVPITPDKTWIKNRNGVSISKLSKDWIEFDNWYNNLLEEKMVC